MRRVSVSSLAMLVGVLGMAIVPAVPVGHADPAPPGSPVRQALYPGGSSYPRLLRLAHSGSANGTILASIDAIQHGSGIGIIEASTDGGKSFHQLATIADPAAAGGAQSCCASLYELPSPIGTMPAGTVLWVDGTGYGLDSATRHVAIRLWASRDHGATWWYVSEIARAANPFPLWEPSLSVAADGQLVAFYSDETDKTGHDQKLVQARSADGMSWTDYTDTVVSDNWYVRPGMATVVRLPDGTYFMSYEVCNNDLVHNCASYYRTSGNGWDYGNPRDLGTVIRTAGGQYGRGTPDLAWSPGPGPDGTLLVISEMMADPDGSLAADDGTVVMANAAGGAGPWYTVPAPIPLPGANIERCRNFSSAVLAGQDGKSVLEAADDTDGAGVCRTFFATGVLPGPPG